MVEVVNRIGRFTSSQIWKLTTNDRSGKYFGAPALTYIEEKRAERCLGRSIDLGKDSQATIWGKIMEHYCYVYHLGFEYAMESRKTDVHPEHLFWSGSKDFTKIDTAGDIKCFEPKNYFLLSMALIMLNDRKLTLEDFKKDFKEVYWQIISNCILLNKPKGEIVAYCPTEAQLIEIRAEIEDTNILEKLGIDPWKGRFITESEIYNLPFVKNPDYPNFVSFSFEVPKEDIEFLTNRVLMAEKLLSNE